MPMTAPSPPWRRPVPTTRAQPSGRRQAGSRPAAPSTNGPCHARPGNGQTLIKPPVMDTWFGHVTEVGVTWWYKTAGAPETIAQEAVETGQAAGAVQPPSPGRHACSEPP